MPDYDDGYEYDQPSTIIHRPLTNQMKHVIIGTAGHVDHGKTTLIKALTGTDTDRLKEEQERGMTIDLGFAALTLPDGSKAGIVDVPGHERFLKNMLAGASGVDVVLLVVAADESVMPQTVEHMDILRLLDVKNGVVALTKADMVDPEWLPVVEDDIRGRLEDTFLADSPVIPVDSLSGKGIPDLKKALFEAVARAEARNSSLPFRLPVDRVFTRPGFGTVVTGTLVAGSMKIGDSVEVLPQRIQTRVRGLQSHGKKQEHIEAGSRVAVNLAGVDVEALERGAVLAQPGSISPTQQMDAILRMLSSAAKPLTHRARVRVYIGTAEIIGRVQILGQEKIEPGQQAYVQFRAEEPFACTRGDRFVLRTYSPMTTVAGGIVLDAGPLRHKRNDPSVLKSLAAKERGGPEDLIATWLQSLQLGGLRKDSAKAVGISETGADAAIESLLNQGEAVALEGGRIIHRTALAMATSRAMAALEAYHSANPLRPGIPREELRGSLSRNADPRAFAALLLYWQQDGSIVVEATSVRKSDFEIKLDSAQTGLINGIVALFRNAGYNAPSLDEAAGSLGATVERVSAMIRVAQEQGQLVKIDDGLYYHRDTVAAARDLVAAYIRHSGSITVSQFRDLTNTSRKYAVPFMEYLDSVKFTRRLGDQRVLVQP